MFVEAFQNGLKFGHFNESLAQKSSTNMDEVMNIAECYIKDEERYMQKRYRDVEQKVQPRHSRPIPRKDHHRHGSRDKSTMKPSWRRYEKFTESFTPLNSKCMDILCKV